MDLLTRVGEEDVRRSAAGVLAWMADHLRVIATPWLPSHDLDQPDVLAWALIPAAATIPPGWCEIHPVATDLAVLGLSSRVTIIAWTEGAAPDCHQLPAFVRDGIAWCVRCALCADGETAADVSLTIADGSFWTRLSSTAGRPDADPPQGLADARAASAGLALVEECALPTLRDVLARHGVAP